MPRLAVSGPISVILCTAQAQLLDITLSINMSVLGKRKTLSLDTLIAARSLSSFFSGALFTDFENIKKAIARDHYLLGKKPPGFLDSLLDELFRYLIILALNSEDGEIHVSPSTLVDKAFHCLLLDPVAYLHVCDLILSAAEAGKNISIRADRVLPHNQLGNENIIARAQRLNRTKTEYVHVFKVDPPAEFWTETIVNTPVVTSKAAAVIPGIPSTTQTFVSTKSQQPQEPQPITIILRDQTGDEIYFKLTNSTPFHKVFAAYAERKGVKIADFRFFAEGESIRGDHCPADYELEEFGQIDVIREFKGC